MIFTKFPFPLKKSYDDKIILTSWLRNTTIVFTLNMESCFMLIGRCHGNDEWRMDFFRRLIQRLSWIMVSSFAQLKARNEKERKTAKCWQLWLYKPWNRCSPPNKRTYFPTSICLASLSRSVGRAMGDGDAAAAPLDLGRSVNPIKTRE